MPEEEAAAARARREAAVQKLLAAEDAAVAADADAPTIAAGWYPHPEMPNMQRYWNGTAWGEHTMPTPASDPRSAARESGSRDEVAFAWTIALLPLLWLPFDYFAPAWSASSAAFVVAVILNGTLATWDAKALTRRGVTVNRWWGWLLVPVYLIQRTSRVGSTAFIPIVWFVGAAISALGAFTFAASYEFDGATEAEYLERRIERQVDVTSAAVDCPDKVVRDGDVLWCELRAGRVNTQIYVEIIGEGTSFTYRWRVE